jgi:hypothetical protein
MNGKRLNGAAAIFLFALIVVWAGHFIYMLHAYAGESWWIYALIAVAVIMAAYLLWEIFNLYRYLSARDARQSKRKHAAVSALVLKNENAEGIRYWDLRNKTGVVIGRSRGDELVDVDLSATEYAAAISDSHAVLNYTSGGWTLTDAGSRNGTALTTKGGKLILTPNDPVPIHPGDVIYIAEETALAVE